MSLTFRDAVSLTETEYGWVVLDETGGEFYSLNPSAVAALQVLLTGGGLEQAVERLTELYRIDSATARQDIVDLLGELAAAGLTIEVPA